MVTTIRLKIDERTGLPDPLPGCYELGEIFFSTELDGRTEQGRDEREARARQICWTECAYRRVCLRRALQLGEAIGVWGGMGEYERRLFKAHLRREGWRDEVPEGEDLDASINSFYTHLQELRARDRHAS